MAFSIRGDVAATHIEDYQAQVRAALAALPRPRVLVGASLGGLLAAMNAGAADALVLVNPMPPRGLPDAPRRPAQRAVGALADG